MSDNIQLTHDDHVSSSDKFPIAILTDNISSPLNIGSLFRLSDALGIRKLYLCGSSSHPPNSKITKTARSTEKYVDYQIADSAEQLIKQLKNDNVFIIALEITSSSSAINAELLAEKLFEVDNACIILGAEDDGISASLLSLADLTLHIPMHGKNSSMNVISAASIACYLITQHLKPQ